MEVLRNFKRKFFGINRENKAEIVVDKEPPSRKRPFEEEEVKQTKDSLNHPIIDLHNHPAKRARMSHSVDEGNPSSNIVHATPSPVQAVFARLKSWFSVKSSPELVDCTPLPHTIQAAPPTLYSSAKLDTDEVELLKVVNPKLDLVKEDDVKITEVSPLLQAADKLAAFAGFTSPAATPPPSCPGKGGHAGHSIRTAHDKARRAELLTPENIRSRLHAGYRSTYDKFYHAKDIAQRGSVKKAKQNAFQYSADLADKMRYKALLERHTGNSLVRYNAWTKETSIMLNTTNSRKGPVRGALDGGSCVDDVDAAKMITSTQLKPRLTSTAIKSLTKHPSAAKDGVEASPVLGREKVKDVSGVSTTPAPRHSPGTPTVFTNRTQANTSGLTWPVNTLSQELSCEDVCSPDYLAKLHQKYGAVARETAKKIQREEEKKLKCQEDTEEIFKSIDERLEAHLKITQVAIPEDEVEEGGDDLDQPTELPDLTPHMKEVIRRAERSRGDVLVDAHKIQITVKDINTLKGLSWLNDEVINFYLQMIVTRSSQDNLPSVYACTTFFYPKLKDGGHASVKRWTKKVDIFSHAIVLIPVHLGMHWCLATIDMQRKAITYYDSMGGNNRGCLKALADYVKEEHLAKKGVPIDMTKWTQVIAKEIPQQMNGSDCGMFTCKFAEYLSRRARFTFSQRDMPYFRQRMIYEIVKNTLIHP